jgi:hypothetical protein
LIGDISIKLDVSPNIQVKPSFFFIQLFLKECLIYSLQVQKPEKTATFFNLLNEVFMRTEVHKELHKIQPVNQLAKALSEHIINREIKEISARDEDIPLQGLFMFLKNIFLKFPEIRDSFEGKNSLLQYLIHDCLFRKETRG